MNKEQPPQNNDEADQEAKAQKAAASWKAWQDWKITCSVAGSNPDNQIILREEIRWAFWHKFKKLFPADYKRIMASSEDWSHVFDRSIHCPEVKKYVDGFKEYAESHPEEAEDHGKFFKDYLWLLIPNREFGSELDFIKGWLIGKTGIINQIVAYYIEKEFPDHFHNWQINRNKKTEDAKKQNVSFVSLDQPIGENKSQTLMDVVSIDSDYAESSENRDDRDDRDGRDDREIDFEAILKGFTWQEIACLLAEVPGKLTHPTTMQFVGINSLAAMSRFNNDKEFNKKRIAFQKYMGKANASLDEKKECVNLMKKRIKVEKNSEEFLNMIEPGLERIFNQIEAYYDKKYKEEEDR